LIEIALMDEGNFREVAAIEAACFSQPWSEKTFFEELSNPNAHTYLAYHQGEAAGFLSVWEVCGEVSINNIAVVQKHRRRGIARALMERMLSDLRGAQSVTLEVRKSNGAAISLYESLGFKAVGERRGFYSLPVEDAILMTKVMDGVD
jgi:ribosomal-protein-alanine N-acetyltransferase